MHQPYYHFFWPAALNYGKLGMLIGHELNHAFDDHGVQWNSDGQLQQWMTNTSMGSFKASANCLINEYNGFCPLDNRTYRPNCVDGVQTQGENLADNGGIR